jgi:hypothetical protein
MFASIIYWSWSLQCLVMAPKLQACMMKFLFDARINSDGEGSQGIGLDSLLLPME